jgi:hypothetical protein
MQGLCKHAFATIEQAVFPNQGMKICVYSVFMQAAALQRADPPAKESYRLSWD